MIPPFDDSGCLPPGVHSAALAEIEARFGRQSDFDEFVGEVFAADRLGTPKGMVEVIP